MRVFLLSLLLLTLMSSLMSCAPACQNTVVQTVSSPAGKLQALVLRRDCRATTGFSTQVSIVPQGENAPKGTGNALILENEVPLRVQWHSEAELQVSELGQNRVFKKEVQVAGVSIRYAN